MRAVILAGGTGTRLRPYTTVLPKPLVPVGDRPILELIIHQLSDAGCVRIDLCVGHLGHLIRSYLTESGTVPDGMRIDYHWEEEPLGTAGALRLIEKPDESFIVMNGDILTTLDYEEFFAAHKKNDAALTIATHTRDISLALGVIEHEGTKVSGYVEKPTLSYDVSMGIYAYSPDALKHVPEGRFDFPDLVLALLAADEPVATFPFAGDWFDIGTRDEHERAVEAFSDDSAKFDAQAP